MRKKEYIYLHIISSIWYDEDMQKIFHTTFLIIFILSFLSPTTGVAIDPTTSGRILDNFKEKQEEILFESSPLDITDASKVLEQEYAMNGLESLKNRLQTLQSAYQSKKDSITESRISLENTLIILAQSIAATEKSIQETTISITEKQQKIQQLRSSELLIKARIRERRQIILSYLTNIYSEGNTVFDEMGNIDLIKSMILSEEDADFTLSDITYKTLVTQM